MKTLFLILMFVSVATHAESSTEHRIIGVSGGWVLQADVDKFSNTFLDYKIVMWNESHDFLYIPCDFKVNMQTHELMGTIGSIFDKSPILVKFKINEKEMTSLGKWPTIIGASDMIRSMKDGSKMEIRTKQGNEFHQANFYIGTFSLALKSLKKYCATIK